MFYLTPPPCATPVPIKVYISFVARTPGQAISHPQARMNMGLIRCPFRQIRAQVPAVDPAVKGCSSLVTMTKPGVNICGLTPKFFFFHGFFHWLPRKDLFVLFFLYLCEVLMRYSTHVFVGPLSPGAALIVKSGDTNFSGNIICITLNIFTIYFWL